MNRNLYKRLSLSKQGANAPDGETVAREIFDRTQNAIEDFQEKREDADLAYDLLALWASSLRLEASLIDSEAETAFSKLNDLVRENAEALVGEALELPDPEAWLDTCQDLNSEDFEEESVDPLEYHATIRTLFRDLDDAELVAYASRKLGFPDSDLEKRLESCLNWLAGNVDFWLCLGSYLRATGDSFRDDLPEFDPELAMTGEKFVVLLDALERAMRRLSYRNVDPLPASAARALVSHITGSIVPATEQKQRVKRISLFPFKKRGLTLAASTTTEAPRRLEMAFFVPELDCELVLIQLIDGSIGVEVYDHEGEPSYGLKDCQITKENGELLYAIDSSEGQFVADSAIDHVLLQRYGEVLELEAKGESR